MTTEQRDHRGIDARLPDRALVVFEQTANGRAALSYAVERARRAGAELTVLRAMPYERVDMGCASCRHSAAIWNREMRHDAEEALAEARELVDDGASITYAIARGQVARAGETVTEMVLFCVQRRHLARTVRIALVVGVLLTAINQGDVLLGGHPTTATWIRCGLNFLVPFLVSNAGLVSGRR